MANIIDAISKAKADVMSIIPTSSKLAASDLTLQLTEAHRDLLLLEFRTRGAVMSVDRLETSERVAGMPLVIGDYSAVQYVHRGITFEAYPDID